MIQDNLCLLLNLRWMKEDSSGGRKDRKIELEMRFFWKGEWMTMNTMNTLANSTKENVSFINKNMFFSLKIIPFIGFKV